MLWQTETMWMHTADNVCIVPLFHADPLTLLYAIIECQFTDLYLLRNNITKYQRGEKGMIELGSEAFLRTCLLLSGLEKQNMSTVHQWF